MKLKSTSFFILKFGIAFIIIYYLLSKQNLDDFKRVLNIPFYCFLIVFFLYEAQMLLGAFRWKKLLDIQNIHISFYSATVLNFQSFFYSLVIPGGALGGDLIKTSMVCKLSAKGMRLEPAISIFMDRIVGMMALFLGILLTCFIAFYPTKVLSSETQFILTLLLPICLVGFCFGFIFFFHRFFENFPIIRFLFKLAHHYSHGKLERIFSSFDAYRSHFFQTMRYVVMSLFCIHLAASIILLTLCYALNLPLLIMPIIFAGLAGNAAAVIPLSVGGFGFREATIYFILRDIASIPAEDAALVVLIYGLTILTLNLLGGISLFFPYTFKNKKELHDTL